jgi:hypothetical protein
MNHEELQAGHKVEPGAVSAASLGRRPLLITSGRQRAVALVRVIAGRTGSSTYSWRKGGVSYTPMKFSL